VASRDGYSYRPEPPIVPPEFKKELARLNRFDCPIGYDINICSSKE
jgi:hypothetical protein